MTAWAPSVRTNTAQAAMAMQQHRYGSPGQVYTQRILVRHKNGQFEWKTLFLVCRPSRVVAIVDSDGRSYRDLDDFRAQSPLHGGFLVLRARRGRAFEAESQAADVDKNM